MAWQHRECCLRLGVVQHLAIELLASFGAVGINSAAPFKAPKRIQPKVAGVQPFNVVRPPPCQFGDAPCQFLRHRLTDIPRRVQPRIMCQRLKHLELLCLPECANQGFNAAKSRCCRVEHHPVLAAKFINNGDRCAMQDACPPRFFKNGTGTGECFSPSALSDSGPSGPIPIESIQRSFKSCTRLTCVPPDLCVCSRCLFKDILWNRRWCRQFAKHLAARSIKKLGIQLIRVGAHGNSLVWPLEATTLPRLVTRHNTGLHSRRPPQRGCGLGSPGSKGAQAAP